MDTQAYIERIAYWQDKRREIDAEISRLRASQLKGSRHDIVINYIIHEAALDFKVPEAYILGKNRSDPATRARHAAVFLVRELTELSFPEIGARFGRDHSTMINSVKMARRLMANEPDGFRLNMQRIRGALSGFMMAHSLEGAAAA